MTKLREKKKVKASTKVKGGTKGKTKVATSTRPSLSARNEKRVKVESGVKSLPKAMHHVRIVAKQVREIYGYVAEETDTTVVFKTRPLLGASRKAQYLHIDRSDIVLFEGKLGKVCRALINANQLLAEYKDVTVAYKDSTIILKNSTGDEIKVLNQNIPGVHVEISGDASE